MPPRVYLRVGPNAPEHTTFIEHLGNQNDLRIFRKNGMTPVKVLTSLKGGTRFCNEVRRYKGKKMVAFDNIDAKHMVRVGKLKRLGGHPFEDVDAWVFSINDKGMKSCGEVSTQDILDHSFGKDTGHVPRLYHWISEIHHMLPDGTVRILARGCKELEDPIVLTEMECLERETIRV
jgi:hypothetical protein